VGLFDDADIAALRGFHRALEEIFSTDFAVGSRAEASNVRGGEKDGQFGPPKVLTEDVTTYWATEDGVRQATLELRLPADETFNVVRLQVGPG
jgi:alpha-L-fucosidase